MFCYQCDAEVTYLFPDSRCKSCTRFTPEEIQTGDCPNAAYECDCDECLEFRKEYERCTTIEEQLHNASRD